MTTKQKRRQRSRRVALFSKYLLALKRYVLLLLDEYAVEYTAYSTGVRLVIEFIDPPTQKRNSRLGPQIRDLYLALEIIARNRGQSLGIRPYISPRMWDFYFQRIYPKQPRGRNTGSNRLSKVIKVF